ncbi:MAG TPA: hypothetical protein VKU00_08935, partial [Chthonomonadaceae bacterium]|nr:hypothetical protein [Chthonomonadaceae bacterium]
ALSSLGWRNSFIQQRVNTNFLRAVIPQPSGTTTLAEALVVLSLAKRSYQIGIWNDFSSRVNPFIRTSTQEALGVSTLAAEYQVRTTFPNLKRFMGTGTEDGAGIHSFQREVVDQLGRNAISPMLEYLRGLAARKDDLAKRLQEIDAQAKANPMLPPDLVDHRALLKAQQPTVQKDLQVAFGWLARSTVYQNDFLNEDIVKSIGNASSAELEAQARGFRDAARFRLANAREAALNETLKKYVQAVDDDLQQQFVEPMFDRLRKRLVMEAKVGVGIIQRTSVLASNRLVARVDPSASAQLAVGEEQNILQETLQLTQLIGAAQTGGLTSVLGGLDRLPPSTPPGVYGITTGNVFQVTPIADPTGQALRFRFDHVLSSPIREPNNTTNPQLSRIERHSINTEVQLSNNEIRTISQFDSNAQIGLPTRHSGGIPILRDLPVLRDIPLIGWFTVSKGRAPIVQQSLVLGQTSIFPTIGDVIELLTRPISFVDLNQTGAAQPQSAGGK